MATFYKTPPATTSGSVRNLAFSEAIRATHRLLRAEAPRDVEILANIIEPEVMKSAISAYDLGTGPAPKGVLKTEDVRAMVEEAITMALESHDEDWFSLKQAAVASKGSPLLLEDPALEGKSATEISEHLKVTRRTVFRWRKDLKNASQADRKRWSVRTSIKQAMSSTKQRYERWRRILTQPKPQQISYPVGKMPAAEIMNLVIERTYPKMTMAGILSSLGALAA